MSSFAAFRTTILNKNPIRRTSHPLIASSQCLLSTSSSSPPPSPLGTNNNKNSNNHSSPISKTIEEDKRRKQDLLEQLGLSISKWRIKSSSFNESDPASNINGNNNALTKKYDIRNKPKIRRKRSNTNNNLRNNPEKKFRIKIQNR